MENKKGLFTGYHHIGLASDDTAKSLKFYTEVLGGNMTNAFPIRGGEGYLVDMGGGAVVEILPFGEGGTEAHANWAHIALETDDVQNAYNVALAGGARPKSEPSKGQLGDMPITCAFVYGPDNEEVEFFHVGE